MVVEELTSLRSWDGSLDDLVSTTGKLLSMQSEWRGTPLRPPSRPLVVNYRSIGLVSPAVRKRYQWRHLVQLTVGCILVQVGHPRSAVAKRFQALGSDEVLSLLDANEPMAQPVTPTPQIDPQWVERAAHEFVLMLAAGLVAQFKLAHAGQPLAHGPGLTPWLVGAMRRLAGLHVSFGQPVQHDGAHTLIAQARRPLRSVDWGLAIFDGPSFRFNGVRLLDSVTSMPTLDCIDIAQQIVSELDMKEQQAFDDLNAVCDQFGSRADEVYSALREYIVRHPVTHAGEFRRYLEARSMQLAMPFLASSYAPVQPHHLVRGTFHRCPSCATPMSECSIKGHVACAMRQCKSFDAPVPATGVQLATTPETLVAKPHILMYWCGPGLDEVSLYDTAIGASIPAVLYPARDKCDLSTDGDRVGIDVKSHANPFVLATTLNRSIGGLELFSKKIIAVNDQAISRFPDYLDIARRECERSDVEITSVSALRRKLRASP